MARLAGLPFSLKREGGNHTIYDLNGQVLVIPRHKEINEITAKSILKNAEATILNNLTPETCKENPEVNK